MASTAEGNLLEWDEIVDLPVDELRQYCVTLGEDVKGLSKPQLEVG